MSASLSSTSSIKLHCRHCGGEIASDSRRVQCQHCGALFPFACVVCSRNLRTPFPIFSDERYLTVESTDAHNGAHVEAKPLCQDHFLRKCPDCTQWFHAHDNPGFFRCAACAASKQNAEAPEETMPADILSAPVLHPVGDENHEVATIGARHLNANLIALAGAGGAFIGLVCWYLLNLS